MSTIFLSKASDFYQQHESKIIGGVVVLLSIYLLAFAAKLTWEFIPSSKTNINAAASNTAANSQPAGNAQNNAPDISKLLSLNLFGNAQARPEPEQVTQTTDAPETKLNLVLAGVVASSQSDLGAAIISYRNQQNTYGIGDKIEGTNVTLDSIYADRVIIKNRLTKETLMLDGIDFDEANQRARTSPPRVINTPRARAAAVSRPNPQALRQAREQLSKSPESFTDIISLSPHRIENELIGYRVSPGAKPALFNSVGLKNGDIVVELNGLDLSDLQQSMEALKALQEAENLQLEILRAGDFVSLEFDLQSNADNI